MTRLQLTGNKLKVHQRTETFFQVNYWKSIFSPLEGEGAATGGTAIPGQPVEGLEQAP